MATRAGWWRVSPESRWYIVSATIATVNGRPTTTGRGAVIIIGMPGAGAWTSTTTITPTSVPVITIRTINIPPLTVRWIII